MSSSPWDTPRARLSCANSGFTRLNLSRQTGNDPCLVGLLRVYKDYYPEIIVGEAVRGKAAAFKASTSQRLLRLSVWSNCLPELTPCISIRTRYGARGWTRFARRTPSGMPRRRQRAQKAASG